MILEKFPSIYPVKTQDDLNAVAAAAAKDNHLTLYPTHYIKKDDEITGYLSVCVIPIVSAWMHTKLMKPIDSIIALSVAENMARAQGHKYVFEILNKESPFNAIAEKHLGLTKLADISIWGKSL